MGKKILLADDSITIQKVIELTFSDEDFEVITVGNGRLAIERIPEVQPDIVLCDIIMPEKDGYEVCEFVKTHPAFGHLPVLLLTGAFEPFDQERAARVGSNGHLAKPFEPQTLISKVKELLSEPKRAGAPAAASAKPSPAGTGAPGAAPAPVVAPAVAKPVMPTPVPAPAPPPPAIAPEASEVTFIPEEPFDSGLASPQATAARASGAASAASPAYYADIEPAVEMQEIEPEPSQESVYVVETSEADDDRPAPRSAPPWVQPAVEVSWGDRANVGNDAEQAFVETPVFDEVIETEPTAAEAAPSPATTPRPQAEPESIPPMLLEYEPASVPPSPLRPAALPPTPPVAAPRVAAPQPSAAELLEEQAMTFEADDLAPRSPTPPPARPQRLSPPAPEEDVSFADVAAAVEPEPQDELSRGKGPSQAAEVAIPKEMVAQIAQRVVGQLSEKVIREVAWEILPDLAEALIKKEIDRLTAELKEP